MMETKWNTTAKESSNGRLTLIVESDLFRHKGGSQKAGPGELWELYMRCKSVQYHLRVKPS